MIKRTAVLLIAFVLPAAAPAQTLTGLTVEPAEIMAGESVKFTVKFDVTGPINCGLRIHFGDGKSVDYKINQEKDVPLVVPWTYANPGEYKIMAETKTMGTLLKCQGKNQVVGLKVAAAPSTAAAPAKKTAMADTQCPAGWKLNSKSVNKKTGAFTCQAAPGTRPVKVSCPGDLSYFENERKGLLGCRP